MKFCKQLHRIMDISDPEWAPYYTDYKMLKKLLKEMQHSPTTTTKLTTAKPPPSLHLPLPQERPELIDLAETESEDDEDVKESSQGNTMKKKTAVKNPTTGSHAPSNHQKSLPLSYKGATPETGRTAIITMYDDDDDDDEGAGPPRSSSPPPPPPIAIAKPDGTEEECVEDNVITIDHQREQNEETHRNKEDIRSERSPLHKKQCCKTSPLSMAEKAATIVQEVIRDYQLQQPRRRPPTPIPPIVFHQEIRYNDQEQYFFRCLHLEVRKVSYFYQTMVQDLYVRYEQICQSIVQVLHIRPPATSTRMAAAEATMAPHKKTTRASRNNRSKNMGALHRNDDGTVQAIRSEFEYGVHRLLSQLQYDRKDDDFSAHRQPSPSDQNDDIPVALLLKIYKLSRDLLLLETYSIMALTSFSKILKKHDKVTGYNTKYAFMTKIVIPSNFVQTGEQPFDNDRRRHRFNPIAVGRRPQHGASRLPRIPEEPVSHYSAAATTKTVPNKKLMVTGTLPATTRRRPTTTTTSTASTTTTVALIPSLRTMIDQCYYWYNVVSEKFEIIQTQQEERARRQEQQQLLQRQQLLQQLQERQQLQQRQQLLQQQQHQRRQPPPTLQYDEFLFLHMVNQFQR